MGESGPAAAAGEPTREPWGSWSSLFQHSSTAVFLLSRRRQIRYVNRAWEKLAGKSAETVRGLFCHRLKKKGPLALRGLLQALAPPTEIAEGRTLAVRRPAPPARLGPPWWDISFVPLQGDTGLIAILGLVRQEGSSPAPGSSPGLSEALIQLRQRMQARFSFEQLQGETPAMARVEAQCRLAAQIRTPVWVTGERGVGKLTLARIIHFNGITREQTFLPVDGAGIQPFLIRSMLFGDAGQAGPRLGTIFISEPAAMPLDLQAEIVEWYDEQEEPPRVIVASNDSTGGDYPPARIAPTFHTAFSVLEIRLPALRERFADLPVSLRSLLRRELPGTAPLPEVAPEAQELLRRHGWPENFRELGRVLKEALEASGGQRITPAHLPLELRAGTARPPLKPVPPLEQLLEQVEARLIRLALQKARGNKSDAANQLGITRGRLLRRIKALKIEEV